MGISIDDELAEEEDEEEQTEVSSESTETDIVFREDARTNEKGYMFLFSLSLFPPPLSLRPR